MKKGQITIWVIIAMFFVGAVIVAVMMWSAWEPEAKFRECNIPDDCWPATCYDPNECVPKDLASYPYRAYCSQIVFTEDCSTQESYDVTVGSGDDAVTVPYTRVSECNVINKCSESYNGPSSGASSDLQDCNSVRYTPNCDLKVNLDPRCHNTCDCDAIRHICIVAL